MSSKRILASGLFLLTLTAAIQPDLMIQKSQADNTATVILRNQSPEMPRIKTGGGESTKIPLAMELWAIDEQWTNVPGEQLGKQATLTVLPNVFTMRRLQSSGKNVQLCLGLGPAGSALSNRDRRRGNIYERIENLVRRNRAFRYRPA
jgi:hypothetical protein